MEESSTREYPLEEDRVYYTGDMANSPAWCTITEVHIDSLGRPVYVALVPDGESERWTVHWQHVGHEYHGHCDPRFVTAAAYYAYHGIRCAS